MSNIDKPSDHRGVLEISDSLFHELLPEVTIDDTNTQGHLRDTGVFARLKEKLLLPESYIIVGIFLQHFGRIWALLIESPDLPSPYSTFTYEAMEYPRIDPHYTSVLNEETGQREAHLVDIKVVAQRTVAVSGGLDWMLKATVEPVIQKVNAELKTQAEIEQITTEVIKAITKRWQRDSHYQTL